MASSANTRNAKIYKLLRELLAEGRSVKATSMAGLAPEVESLFTTHIWGHREIVLTILVARLLDPKYRASRSLYKCKPRALYEGPIRLFLDERGIPRGKSGPLNIAKNIKKINEDWAANKREVAVALNVVRIVKVTEELSPADLRKFAALYVARYQKEAARVKKLAFKPSPNEDPIALSSLCLHLIRQSPDGGAMPQRVIGLLLDINNREREGSAKVEGHLDSVSTTNTTSKKAGDMVERLSSGSIVYEVTVKKFDAARTQESYEALRADLSTAGVKEVVVICMPENMHAGATQIDSKFVMGLSIYQDVAYYFVDIREFIWAKLMLMTPKSRGLFQSELAAYINEPNRSEKVKLAFRQWHEGKRS